MDFTDALKLSKEEFKRMAEFQELLLNINDENLEEVQKFINMNFDFNNHSSVQKFCHTLGSIAGVRPNNLSFYEQIFLEHKAKIELILREKEKKFYSIFTIINDSKNDLKSAKIEQKEQENTNLQLITFIENDNLESFQKFLSQTNTNHNAKIHQFKYFSVKPINDIELIEYTALCGSLNIFKFLLNQIEKFPKKMKNFAVAGGNSEIIHIIEQNATTFNDDSFRFDQETIETSIEFHRNDLFEYLIENYELCFDVKSLNSSIVSNNFILMNKYLQEKLFNEFTELYFYYFIVECLNKSISNNISFIEFAIKIKNEEIESKKENVVFCISSLNYDSVAQCIIKYNPYLIEGDEFFTRTVNCSLVNELFDAITVFIKFLNENQKNRNLMMNIFSLVSNSDNELVDVFLNFDNISFNNEFSPLFSAIRIKNLCFLKKLLKNKKLNVNVINPLNRITPLIYAYEKKEMIFFECLLDDVNVDVNVKDLRDGSSVLHLACFDDNFDYVKVLFDKKKDSIDVNIRNDLNQTPLHLAAIEKNVEIVEYLVKVGKADIGIKDDSNVLFLFLTQQRTPLTYLMPDDMIRIRKIVQDQSLLI